MIIQYASDLHLEFAENHSALWTTNLKPVGDILILAGDIVPFRQIADKAWFFDYVAENFKITYWIPGNHEYYYYDLASKRGSFCEQVRENVFLINDYAVTHNNVRLIFATLWTKVKRQHRLAIERRMNDFHLIQFNGNRLTCTDLDIEHETSLAFIKHELELAAPGYKTIVVTHHVPTSINYPPEYFGDVLNEAFAVDLTKFINTQRPDYWIYGHHHSNIPEFQIGKTTLLTNQLGYVRYQENKGFDNSKTFEI